ncbi:hypothetical protein [Desulfolithobacter dissulfuricans]|uniref:Uncharacterized protein n=1 Tax=Desulfolithobacter dissulfuricans TaxID=2795293 RepID=A0A915U5W2_9BACT|nr:hypothetical protein [Desulfolithobacter dissulfuricans]BCO09562.1 hypothetical protein GF1_19380 [Desulfolithobacter dissulfuricans]
MSQEEEIRFLPYEEAIKIVAAIQEEEDIEEPNHRILTVYNHDDREICWFDFDEVMEAVGPVKKTEEKEAVSNYILHRIPDWALDI